MQKRVDLLTYICILFVILLFVSGISTGIMSDVVYILAFAVPIFFGLRFGADREDRYSYFKISRKDIGFVLPTVPLVIAVIFLLSFLSSLLIYLASGKTNAADVGDSIPLAILTHALLPAILEEALFRYLPMRMLGKRSPRTALLISSVYFALVHHSFFTIPYALAAGFIFMALDLATDSVLPSFGLHFINNLISIFWILYSGNAVFVTVFLIALALLTLASLAYIFCKRESYKEKLIPVFDEGEGCRVTLVPLFLIIPTLLFALAELV